MKSNTSLIYNLFLVAGDFLALVAAFVGAFIIRAQSTVPVAHPISGHTYVYVFLSVLPFWILIFALLGLYNSNIYERRFSEFGRLLIGSFIGMLFVIVVIQGLLRWRGRQRNAGSLRDRALRAHTDALLRLGPAV